jgi:hypothetical protein
MRLGFTLSLLLLSTTFSGFAIAAEPDIHSNNALRQNRQSIYHPNGDRLGRPDMDSAQPDKKIIFASDIIGLGFGPAMVEVESASKPGVTPGSSIEAPFIDKHYFSSETGISDDEEASGAAPLPNALWLIGFGVFWILGARKNLDSSNTA